MNQFQFKTLTLEQKNPGILLLTIQRPEALNALNSEVLNELGEVFRLVSELSYDDVKVLVITGSGTKAFVAGADIKEISALDSESAVAFATKGQSVFHEMRLLKIPVIAAVNGFALGGGCELALACDFIFASSEAQFGLPEVTLGLIPGFGGTVRLARAVGIRKARELTYTGERIDAHEAFRLGLVNKVSASGELLADVLKVAETISRRAPVAISAAKVSIDRSWDMDVETAQKSEAEIFGQLFETSDVKEGTTAFIEKRKPAFKGN